MTSQETLEKIFRFIKKFIPKKIFRFLQPTYHLGLAYIASIIYRHPSRQIKIVAITGTKGKTTTVELVNAILEEAGFKTALSSTLRQKIGADSTPNLFKMTTPGRFFLQRFLRNAVDAGCQWVVLELTSEAARQYRHRFIELDAFIFTNIAPEHIESHGGFNNYLEAKLSIARTLSRSRKRPRILIANIDNEHGHKFFATDADAKAGVRINDAIPHHSTENGSTFTFLGTQMATKLPGKFNVENILCALHFANLAGISMDIASRAILNVDRVPGRAEIIHTAGKFDVVIDYAHTPDSLKAIYETFSTKGQVPPAGNRRLISVFGACGGGRDVWKRPRMGEVADRYCDKIILTDQDPYDEDANSIVEAIASGVKQKEKMEIVLDRREAIAKAISLARKGDVIIITGKGADPYIMQADGKKLPWSDRKVAEDYI